MIDRHFLAGPRWVAVRERAERLYRSHRLRRNLLIAAIVLLVFGLLGFFAAPPIIRSQLQTRLGAALGRTVTIGAAHLNPYTLRLDLDQLHIADADGHSPFVDVDRLTINASWTSLFRLAPVLDELAVQRPRIRLVRTGPQRFNFSDMVERFSRPSDPNAKPARFALANISVHGGDIAFDDQVLKTSHRVDRIEVGVPFLANLPADTDLFVQPLLAMRVDGSPLRIEGQTKPFANSRESVMTFQIDHLDLPKYLAYAPTPLPVAVPRGQLSGKLELHFVVAQGGNQLRLGGGLALDDFALNNPDGVALLELERGTAELVDVQPLQSRYHLGAISLDKATLHYHRTAGGHSNFDSLAAPAPPGPAGRPTEVRIDTLSLSASRFDYVDLGSSGDAPGTLQLENLHGTLRGLSTVAAPAAALDIAGQLNGGGVAGNGGLDLAAARFNGKLKLQGVQLAQLQPLALPQLKATVAGGTLDADGQLRAEWGKAVNLHLEPAALAVNGLALKRRDGQATPLAWKSLQLKIAILDLLSREARLDSVLVDGLKLDLQRQRNGTIDLAALMGAPPAPAKGGTAAAAPAWRWSVANLQLQDSDVTFKDLAADRPMPLMVHADHYSIDGLSDDLRKPLKLALTGKLGKGDYGVEGSVKPRPLEADLHLKATGVDIAPLQSLISVPLNVHIASALLSLDGRVRYSDRGKAPAWVDYRGQATFGRVRIQDKLTGDDFLRWHSLTASGMAIRLGQGAPRADIGGIALSDFYTRVIINANGRLNLQDVVANPAAAPVSVTREQGAAATPAKPRPAPATTTAPAAAVAAAPNAGPAAEIHIGQITLARGELNYTDNFIKPNYTANVTGLTGKIGAFGTTGGTPPAELVLQGKLDENSPVDINGTINPLTPVAFLDIKAKADGVELSHLSPYSGKYAGYPITSGKLNVDVHYQLDQRKLAANNHIFITQLTFGDRIEGTGASHLPVKLAVALLKDTDGNIDLNIPVSGSLDDPQFSMGSLVWHAFVNLITRAVTSPFRLLASIGGGNKPDLGYVEFAPGSAVLDAGARSRLEQLVAFLQSKPSLALDISGRIDPSVDENGLRKVMVDDLVRQAKADDDGKHEDPATLQLTPDEYQHYLVRVYKRAKFPKPKNIIGLTKSQPPEEMHQLLETNMAVDAEAMKKLAERRALAVQAWLKGKLDDKRMTLQAPKLDAKGIEDKGKTTRVDFGLH
ncbi:hypothetical protein RHOFW510R12_11960 [Rhodanobacter sp. FW510-R12]|uniref:DUF748 domain-containing protein n=1 Tax=unclassified Rhodanobacter TaxID=2621553 RepID=UPI0007A9E4AD|nr:MULTISPECIES: DUF748 domain-containing protein [unclassified Rhodanobacter]KZC17477.1 hypothetical protein RHOFW104R8_10925 [Rhodanobacter sp. FW104-R8]KZC28437.1 hypothetical protein RhoFW510T8_11265 [Rhodanobacter sp. FW510-T8]KZC32517.1 hypothetical protein RhoFW510R10_12365 [Rhodanobacter sp. FW510-R10]